jgi:hypothetical protein
LQDVPVILTAPDAQLASFVTTPSSTLLADLESALTAHGFSGARVRLKADIINYPYNDYVARGRVRELPPFQERGVWRRLRGVGRRFLNVLNPGSVAM